MSPSTYNPSGTPGGSQRPIDQPVPIKGPIGPQGAAGDLPTGPVENFGAADNYGVPSLPQHLAYNLDRVVTTAPTLQAHPDLAHAAVIAGGDIEQNARAMAGMQMFHEAIQHARDDQVTHHNVEFQMRGYKEIQNQERYKKELVARIRYMMAHPKDFPNGTWEEEEALRKVTPFGDPLYQYSPVVATQQQKDMQAFQGNAEQAGINSEQQGMTLEQTLTTQAAQQLGTKVPAGTFGNTEAGTGPQGAQGAQGQQIAATVKDQPESLWQNFTGAGVDTWHDVVGAWHGAYDGYRALNSDVIGRGGVHEPLWVKLIADTTVSTAESLRHSIAGIPGATTRAATHYADFVAAADDPNQIHPVGPSTPAAIPVAAISQGLFGSSNPMDFLSNTESQFKYLWYVYHNGSTEDFVKACAPIIIGAAIAHGIGGLAKTAFIKSEYASLQAGLSEEEALALANQAAKDAVKHGDAESTAPKPVEGVERPPGAPEPLTAPPRVREDGTPIEPTAETPAKEPVIPKVPTPPEESTFPKEHLAKPSEVKQNIDIVNNKIDGEAIDHNITKKLTAGTTAVVNQALNDMWQRVDQGLWAGLKIKMRIPYDLADMVDYSRVALTERLRQYAETVDVSPADLDLLTRAAQRTLDARVNKFYQAGLDQMKAGKGYKAASAIGQAAVGASRSIFGAGSKVLDATERFSRNEMWVGAQIGSFLVNPQRDPEGWAAAQESSPSIGQALFDGTRFGSVTSGLVDAWAAWTSGPVPVGHLFSRVAGTGEALNLTTKSVDEALHNHIGYRAALKQMEGRTAGEVVQIFPELAKPAYKNGPPIINLLTETVDTGTRLGTKQVLGTPMQIHERFRALVVAEEYPTLAKLPTTSIYGQMRAAKIDGGPILGWFSRNLGQMPFALDKDMHIVKNAIAYGDTAAIPAYARALRVGGMNQKEINVICERLLANPTDQKLWQETAQKSLSDMMGNRVLHHLVNKIDVVRTENVSYKNLKKTLKQFDDGKIELTPRQVADLKQQMYEERFRLMRQKNENRSWQEKAQDRFADAVGSSKSVISSQEVGNVSLGSLLKALKIDRKTLKKFEEGKIKLTPQQQADLNKWIAEKEAILGPHEEALRKVYKAIDEQTRKLVGMSGEGPTGVYSFKRNADGTPGFIDNSRLVNNQTAGGSFTQRGLLLMPSYKQIDKTMYEMMGKIIGDSNMMGKADYHIMRNVLEGSDWINNAFNNSFFKPLAIATGGWATRVSISEATLNTARVGPRNMLGGYAGQNLVNQQKEAYDIIRSKVGEKDFTEVKGWLSPLGVSNRLAAKGYDVPQTVAREIALVVRGIFAGIDMTLLAGIGKADFVDAATELMFKHDGYLSPGISAVHNGMTSTVDLTAVDKVRKHGKKKGMPRTKLRRLGDNFTPVMFGNTGFYSGWQNMAQLISHDDILSRKAAGIYRDLRASGLRGDELHRVAVAETEKIIRDLPKSTQKTMARSDTEHIGMEGEDPLHAWATERVDNLEYIVHGQRGKISLTEAEKEAGMKEAHFHEKLLNDIADANVPDSLDSFMRKYATGKGDNLLTASKLPHSTISREVEDLKGTGNWTAMQRVAAFGHQKAFGPMVNHMVRQPLFIAEYAAVRKRLLPMVEDGTLSADQASVLAEIRATENMIPFIHNPLDKTKLEEMISVGYPFYFAQNQAWRRMGRLFAQDPGKFIQYYIAMSAVTRYVSEVKKNTGFSGVTIPLTMLLLGGIPLTGSTTSIGVVDPFQETSSDGEPQSVVQKAVSMFGPHSGLVPTIAGHIVLLDVPDAMKPLSWFGVSPDAQRRFAKNDWVVGPIGSSENLIDAAIPNSIVKNFKQMIIALASKPDQIATTGPFAAPSYVQAFSEAMSAIMYENMTKEIARLKKDGVTGDSMRINLAEWTAQQFDPTSSAGPAGYNKLMADAKVRALGVLAGKTSIGAFFPLSVGVGDTNPQVRQFRDLLASDPDIGFRGATAKIWTEHPEYMAELMSRSGSVQGNYIPENAAVRKYIDGHTQFVRDNPLAAWAYGPDVTKDKSYSVPANQALIDVGERKKITPAEALDNFFIQLGWNTYYNDIIPTAKDRAERYNNAGVLDPNGNRWTESSMRASQVATLSKDNNQWGQALTKHKAAELQRRTVSQLEALMQKPEVNNTPALRKLNTHLREFLNSPDGYGALATYKEWEKKQMFVGSTLVDNDMVRSLWVDGTIPDWVKKYPDLAPALHTIFANFG